jgi:hypothetical protein
MDYGKILSRAWQITWRWKVLWIFGFLASLGSGGGSGGGGGSGMNNGNRGAGNFPNFDMSPEIGGLIIALVCVALIIGIILWVLSIISRGALIAGVQQVEDEGQTSFGSAWRVGLSRFWTIFGVGFLAALPILIIVLVLIGVGIAVAVGAGYNFTNAMSDRALGIILPALACLIPLACVTVVLAVVLSQIQLYAERAAILEGKGWIDAFKRGWQVLKTNLGPTIVFWLIFLVIGGVLAAIVVGGIVALAVPAVALFGNSNPNALAVVTMCGGALIGFVILAVVGAIVQTFTSTTWTLVYRQLTRPVA